jgi:intergrase/recombinase
VSRGDTPDGKEEKIMRVTKLIREYVVKSINSKIVFGKPTADYEAAKKHLIEVQKDLNEQVREFAEKLCQEANQNQPEGFKVYLTTSSLIYSNYLDAPLYHAANAHEKEIRKRRENAIESILLELELGGTKADLERLIAEAIQ